MVGADQFSRYGRLAADLTRRIVVGDLASGTDLPGEATLARDIGVSRTVVREAMRVLSERGLVQVRQGLATRVNRPDAWNMLDRAVLLAHRQSPRFYDLIMDLMEARRVVEVPAAKMAAARADDAERQLILEAADRLPNEPGEDVSALIEADLTFHHSILKASGNPFVYRAAAPLYELLRVSMEVTIPIGFERTRERHGGIAEAVAAGDGVKASMAMDDHLTRAEGLLRQYRNQVEALADRAVSSASRAGQSALGEERPKRREVRG